VNTHANRVDNPHSVSATQVGASPSSHNHDGSYVNTTGDTMIGALNLPSNGFTVGTNQFVVSGGEVGIGTASPNEMLEIKKGFNGFTGLRIDNPSTGANTEAGIDFYIINKRAKIAVERPTLDLVIENSNAQSGANIMFNTSGGTPGTRMTITGDGKVGIGTTDPVAKLHIEDTNKVLGNYQNLFIKTSDEFGANKGGSIGFGGIFNSIGGHTQWAGIAGRKENSTDGNSKAYLAFSTRDVIQEERVRITSAGNVGIGTTSPQSKLQVEGYVQLALTSGSPPSGECNEASERGRMKVDNSAGLLYICVDSGWVAK
jgi:hypothetical protein